jgi:hypothetical protein
VGTTRRVAIAQQARARESSESGFEHFVESH